MTARSLYAAPDLYDAEFGGYRADLPFYRHALKQHPGLLVELGCGTGRLLRLLEHRRAVGVDLAAAMLRTARARGVTAHLVCGTMDAPPLAPCCAGLVVLAYNLVQHCVDEAQLVRVLLAARGLLAAGGGVALDMFMPPRPGSARVDAQFVGAEQRVDRHGRVWDVAEQTVVAGRVQTTRLRFDDGKGAGAPAVSEFARTLWPAEVVLAAVAAAGLSPVDSWGDVDGAAFLSSSPRLMLRAVAAS